MSSSRLRSLISTFGDQFSHILSYLQPSTIITHSHQNLVHKSEWCLQKALRVRIILITYSCMTVKLPMMHSTFHLGEDSTQRQKLLPPSKLWLLCYILFSFISKNKLKWLKYEAVFIYFYYFIIPAIYNSFKHCP